MIDRPMPPARYQKTSQAVSVGGYGAVEVWHDTSLDRDVAIKWVSSPEGEEQLLNEWQVLAKAASRHVVEIYDLVFDDEGRLHGIVMEFVSGHTLADVASPSNEIELGLVLHLLYQLAVGLSDLHKNGIVHRDIKPENVVVGADGYLRVCDFGLSGPPSLETLRSRGTMGYRAPELFRRPAVLALPSDVYSFGAVCCKVLTGALPNVGPLGMV